MQPKMTDDQKRELTLKIYRWMQETDPSFDNKEVCKYCDGSISDVPIRWFSPLDNRDDWALVEEEIERRGLWKEYCVNLYKRLGFDLNKERPSDTIISFNLRRASPLVCAQAWDEMVEYMKHEKQNMPEQEATELIATKLMGWKSRFLGEEQALARGLTPFVSGNGAYYDDDTFIAYIDLFNPFHDSNHARMVKNHIGYIAPHTYAQALAKRLNLPSKIEDWTWVDAFSYHNAPDADCMWAVVDALKEQP